jgi:hypothetical protein
VPASSEDLSAKRILRVGLIVRRSVKPVVSPAITPFPFGVAQFRSENFDGFDKS